MPTIPTYQILIALLVLLLPVGLWAIIAGRRRGGQDDGLEAGCLAVVWAVACLVGIWVILKLFGGL